MLILNVFALYWIKDIIIVVYWIEATRQMNWNRKYQFGIGPDHVLNWVSILPIGDLQQGHYGSVFKLHVFQSNDK